MKKADFLAKTVQLRAALFDADPEHEAVELLDRVYDLLKDDHALLNHTNDGSSKSHYEKLICDKFDTARLSIKPVTATQLCDMFGLQQNKKNQMGIAKALRDKTGSPRFRISDKRCYRLPFNKDGTLEVTP